METWLLRRRKEKLWPRPSRQQQPGRQSPQTCPGRPHRLPLPLSQKVGLTSTRCWTILQQLERCATHWKTRRHSRTCTNVQARTHKYAGTRTHTQAKEAASIAALPTPASPSTPPTPTPTPPPQPTAMPPPPGHAPQPPTTSTAAAPPPPSPSPPPPLTAAMGPAGLVASPGRRGLLAAIVSFERGGHWGQGQGWCLGLRD